MPVCVPTKECLVFHCVTCTSISRGFESKPLTNAPTVCNSSFFELIVVKTWCRDLIQLLNRFDCQFTTSFHISSHDVPCHKTKRSFSHATFHNQANFSVALADVDPRFEHLSVLVNHTFVRFSCALSALQEHMIKQRCRFSQINVFHPFLPHGIEILLLSSLFHIIQVF